MKPNNNQDSQSTKLSRRDFLKLIGKLAGLGALAHFSMIGIAKDRVDDGRFPREREICKVAEFNHCVNEYTCNGSNPHTCHEKFMCHDVFNCSSNSTNHCTSVTHKEWE